MLSRPFYFSRALPCSKPHNVTIHYQSICPHRHFHGATTVSGTKLPRELPFMARLPTKLIVRSLVLTSLMSSKHFMTLALALLNVLSSSNSAFLNPDRNRALNKILRWTVYNHFCAGTNHEEVSKTVAEIKQIGYQGVILGYSKEIVVDPNEKFACDKSGSTAYNEKCHRMVEDWKNSTLETLRMIGPGDFLAVK